MELFSIGCETCRAKLKVTSLSAVNQILACPRCGSMVMASPPPGWTAPANAKSEEQVVGESEAIASTETASSATAPTGSGPQPPPGWEQPFGMQEGDGRFGSDWSATTWVLAVGAPCLAVMGLVGLYFSTVGSVESEPTKPPEVAVKTDAEAKPDPVAVKDPGAIAPEKPAPEPIRLLPATGAPPSPAETAGPPAKVEPPPTAVPNSEPPARPAATVVRPTPPPPLPADKLPAEKLAVTEMTPKVPAMAPAIPVNPAAAEAVKPLALMSMQQVEARLADPIAEIDLPGVPLSTAIDFLSRMSTLKITLDIEGLSSIGVTVDDPVTVQLSEVTVGEVLERVLEQRGLSSVIENGQLRVTSPGRSNDAARDEVYAAADLAPDAAALAELVALTQSVVKPGGRVVGADGQVTVHHHDAAQRRVSVLFRKLRAARGLATEGAAEEILRSKFSKARERLSAPITVNFVDTPLDSVASQLQKRCGMNLFVDGLALSAIGRSPREPATVRTKEAEPLGVVLGSLLEPLELTYRVVDAKTLQITTPSAASARLDLEIYKLGAWATDPAALVEELRKGIGEEAWGQTGPGVLHLDAASRSIVVLHHQGVQVQIEEALRQMEPQAAEEGNEEAGPKGEEAPKGEVTPRTEEALKN